MSSELCLEGIKVVDMSRVLALPLATMILSDLGAEVIKIENPNGGDETRGWGPPYLGDESAYYLCVNRNKKSITIDIKTEEGQKIIHKLAKDADIFVENFKPGSLRKYNLDYDTISSINPSIIYCSLSGFGQNNPNSSRPGYDFIIQGLSGLMSITGEPDGEPMKVGVALTDVMAGLYAVVSILAALYSREKNGKGEYIDIALFDTTVASLVNVASNYLVSGKLPKRYGNAHPNIVPYQTFKAKDKYFNIAVGNDHQWNQLVKELKDSRLESEEFATNPNRVKNRDKLIPILQEIFKKKTAKEWLDMLKSISVPCGEINTLEDVFNDPQIEYRNLVGSIKHPKRKDLPDLKLVLSPIKFKNRKIKDPSYPPALGEHTDEILSKIKNKL